MSMKNFWSMVTKDKREQERVKAARQIALGFGAVVIAAAAGLATGVLFAPKSGKETRDALKQHCIHCMNHQACTCEKQEDSAAPGDSGNPEKA